MLLVAALVFRFIAATNDGGAYLVSQDGDATILERVVIDGGRLRVQLPGVSRIDAIATRGDALWIATPDAVVVSARWGAAETARVAIPPALQRDESNARETTILPLGDGRAFVLRACADAKTRIDDCTEVITVDVAASTATTRTWAAQLSRAVSDERGGAWMRVEHAATQDLQAPGTVGYAHANRDGTWDLWTFDGMIVPGMMAHAKSPAFPEFLAPAADGVWGISQFNVWPIADDGVPRTKLERDELAYRGVSQIHGAATSGGELVLLTGIYEVCCFTEHDYDDTSPVLRWITRDGVERAADITPAPSWWRELHHEGTPPAQLALAGGVAWVRFEDLVMMRVPPSPDEDSPQWFVVGEQHPSRAPEAPASEARHFWSFSTLLGYSRAGDDDGFARGLRLERMRTANRKRPILGTGGYAEVSSLGGRVQIGSGLSVGIMRIGAVASVGASVIQDASDAWHPQLVASLFVGKRVMLDDAPLEAPLGLRFEVRPRTADLPTTFMVATSLDVLVVVAVGLLAGAM